MSEGSRSPVRYVYPTISPQVVVIPIVSCIIVFPILVLIVICALRYRAIRARRFDKLTRGRRMGLAGGEHGARTAVMEAYKDGRPFVQCKNGKRKTIVRFKPMPELDLDTVVEERSEFDTEVNALELLQAPQDPTKLCVLNHPVSFRSFRFGYGASGQPIKKTGNYGRPIGSPKPKRAKTAEDILTCEKETISSDGPQNTDFNTEQSSPNPILGLQMLMTDVDGDRVRSDRTSVDCHPEVLPLENTDTIKVNSMTDEAPLDKGSFVIPSVSVQACLDDSSDDSLSYIDKSEEIQFVNECRNAAVVRMSTFGYQVKDSMEETNTVRTETSCKITDKDLPSATNLSTTEDKKCIVKSQLTLNYSENVRTTSKNNLNDNESSSSNKEDPVDQATTLESVQCDHNYNESTSETRNINLESVGKTCSMSSKSQLMSLKDNLQYTGSNNFSNNDTRHSFKEVKSSYKNNLDSTGITYNTNLKSVDSRVKRSLEATTEPKTTSIFSRKWSRNSHKPTHLDDPLDYRQNMLLMRSRSAADVIKTSSMKNTCSFSLPCPSDDGTEGQPCDGIEGQRCDDIEGQRCDGIEGQPCDGIEGKRCDSIEDEPCDSIEGKPCDGIKGQSCDGMEGKPCDDREGQPCDDREGQRCDGREGQPCDGREGQRCDSIEGQRCDGKDGLLTMPFKNSSLDSSFTGPKNTTHSYDLDLARNCIVKLPCQPKSNKKLEEFKDSFNFRTLISGCSVEEFIEADESSDGEEV